MLVDFYYYPYSYTSIVHDQIWGQCERLQPCLTILLGSQIFKMCNYLMMFDVSGSNARARSQPRPPDVPELSDGDHHEDLQQAQHDGLESQPDPLLHHALALLLSPLLCGQSTERQT